MRPACCALVWQLRKRGFWGIAAVEDPHERLFQLAREGPDAWSDRSLIWRKRWRQWMLVLLGTSFFAFSVSAVWLSRLTVQTPNHDANSQAVKVVQEHFAALRRGDFLSAYSLFSPRLRRKMPFQEFHAVMETRLSLLQGRMSVFPEESKAGRVVVDAAFHGNRRRHMNLTAEFMLVRSSGRWLIDDMHWNMERVRPQRVIHA